MRRTIMFDRLNAMTERNRVRTFNYLSEGNGSGNAKHECPATVKEINAVIAWLDLYRYVTPTTIRVSDAMLATHCLYCARALEGSERKTALCTSDDCTRHDHA